MQARRARADGWTGEREALFLERLQDTCVVPLAAAEVGLSSVSAYLRRRDRPGFAAAWAEAQRRGWPPVDRPWVASALCFMAGEPQPEGNPVRFTCVGEVLQAMKGKRCGVRGPRSWGKGKPSRE